MAEIFRRFYLLDGLFCLVKPVSFDSMSSYCFQLQIQLGKQPISYRGTNLDSKSVNSFS